MQGRGHAFTFEKFGTHFRSDSWMCDRLFRALVRDPVFQWGRRLLIRAAPGCRREFGRVLEANIDAIKISLSLQGGSVFLDASKDLNRLLYLNSHPDTEVTVLTLTRDGRGVSNSMRRHFGMSIGQAASQWKAKYFEISKAATYLKEDQVMSIRYEDFCAAPKEHLRELFAFAGLAEPDGYARRRASDIHLLGNQMRLSSSSEIRLDEKWKRRMDTHDLKEFSSAAGRLNTRLGYDSDCA
jgi:hypothetical protein